MLDPGIVRNRFQGGGFISNARPTSRSAPPWGHSTTISAVHGGEVAAPPAPVLSGVAQSTAHSDAMSKDLKREVSVRRVDHLLAFMQAVGIVMNINATAGRQAKPR